MKGAQPPFQEYWGGSAPLNIGGGIAPPAPRFLRLWGSSFYSTNIDNILHSILSHYHFCVYIVSCHVWLVIRFCLAFSFLQPTHPSPSPLPPLSHPSPSPLHVLTHVHTQKVATMHIQYQALLNPHFTSCTSVTH